MQLRTLGALELEGAPFRHPKPLLLLAYLTREGPQPRKRVAALFWPASTDPLNRLSVMLSRLRKNLPGAVWTDGESVGTALPSDVDRLDAALVQEHWGEVAQIYRGAFLANLYMRGLSVEVDDWIADTADAIARRVGLAYVNAAEAALRDRLRERAMAFAELAAGVTPCALEGHELERLYAILLAAGSAEAAVVRREARGWDLDLAPSPTEARARLGVPDHGARTAPPAAGAGALTQHNLRPWTTGFVGRRRELSELGSMLERADHRLITVIGQGGIGKSRVAWQVASEQVRTGRFASCWFVELEDLDSAERIPERIGESIGSASAPTAVALGEVASCIADRRMLVVLDTCEHLDGAATLVSTLLAACPGLTIMATSRVPLRLAEEWRYPLAGFLPPVPVAPAGSDLATSGDAGSRCGGASDGSALELFEARARRTSPGYRLPPEDDEHVAEICRLTGGSPLALELAAGWVLVTPLRTIVREIQQSLDVLHTPLQNVPHRHRSLRAVLDQTWNALGADERDAMMQLAVFRGGFDREMACAVAGTGRALLASLIAQSLVVEDAPGHFELHPLVRAYSAEALAQRSDLLACVEARHAAYFLTGEEPARELVDRARGAAWRAWPEASASAGAFELTPAYSDRRDEVDVLAAPSRAMAASRIRRRPLEIARRGPARLAACRAAAGDRAAVGETLQNRGGVRRPRRRRS